MEQSSLAGVGPLERRVRPHAEALKACPFCGVVGLDFAEGSTFRWLAYSCSGCGIGNETRVQTMGEGTNAEWQAQAKSDAVAAWNKHKLMGWSREPVAASGAPLTRQQREFVRFGLNQRNYPVNEEDFAEYVRLIEQAHGLDA